MCCCRRRRARGRQPGPGAAAALLPLLLPRPGLQVRLPFHVPAAARRPEQQPPALHAAPPSSRRCMLRVTRGSVWPERHYKFAGHCHVHGNVRAVGWQDLSEAWCRCGAVRCGAGGRGGGGGGVQDRHGSRNRGLAPVGGAPAAMQPPRASLGGRNSHPAPGWVLCWPSSRRPRPPAGATSPPGRRRRRASLRRWRCRAPCGPGPCTTRPSWRRWRRRRRPGAGPAWARTAAAGTLCAAPRRTGGLGAGVDGSCWACWQCSLGLPSGPWRPCPPLGAGPAPAPGPPAPAPPPPWLPAPAASGRWRSCWP